MDDITDEGSLVQRILEGDHRAFSQFYDEHIEAVYRYSALMVSSRQDAEDVTQIVFLAALDSLRSFRGRSSLRTWLFAIARNKANDLLRRRRGDLRIWEHFARRVRGEVFEEDPEIVVAQRSSVEMALQELTDAQRETIVLKYVEGMSVKEIASITGRSAKAVESLLTRGREQLKALLLQEARAN